MGILIDLAITSISSDSNPAISGPINLVAGTNITLTQTGNQITIDSTGGGGSSPWQESAGIVTLINYASQVNLQTGNLSSPALTFGAGTEGIFSDNGNDLKFSVNNTLVCTLNAAGVLSSGAGQGFTTGFMKMGYGTASATTIGIDSNGTDTVGLVSDSLDQLTIDNLAGAGETSTSIRPLGEGLQRISVGAADSGGVGFRALIIPN